MVRFVLVKPTSSFERKSKFQLEIKINSMDSILKIEEIWIFFSENTHIS